MAINAAWVQARFWSIDLLALASLPVTSWLISVLSLLAALLAGELRLKRQDCPFECSKRPKSQPESIWIWRVAQQVIQRLPCLPVALAPCDRARIRSEDAAMMTLLLWLLLLIFCWPLALLALILWPLVWLIALPFRLLGFAVDGVFEFLRALFMLPARVLGGRPAR